MSEMENAYALVVGIANYQDINPLPEVVLKDAKDIANVLMNPDLCGYKKENVKLLLDEQATKSALEEALAKLATKSNPDSSVFIYVSSHGGRIGSGDYCGEYLLPVDVVYDSDESLAQSAISDTQLTDALRAISAGKLVVIFDCCHAGGIGEAKGAVRKTKLKDGLSNSYYEKLKMGKGRVIIASSRDDEKSWIMPNSDNSLFTKHLLAGLKGGITSEDGLIRIFDLFEYVQPKVTLEKPVQHPIFKAELEESFPVALYLGGTTKNIAPKDNQGFRYDAYISYVEKDPDLTWVWETLVPKLEEAGLKIAISGDVEQLGVERVVGVERAIRQSKRTIIVLSRAYLLDNWSSFNSVSATTMDIQEGTYRLLPIKIEKFDDTEMPIYISRLTSLDFAYSIPKRIERSFERLVETLKANLPTRYQQNKFDI